MTTAPHDVGFRNQLRRNWRSRPESTRNAISMGIVVALAILLYFVDNSLAYAVLLGGAVYQLAKLPLWPQRVTVMGAIVGLLVILALVGNTPWSLVLLLAAVFAVSSIPLPSRTWALPLAFLVAAVMYPFYYAHLFTLPVFGQWPDVPTGVYMLVFMMMAVGLNIVVGYAGLLDLGYVAFYATGAYTTAWFASAQFSGQRCPTPGVSVANCAQALVPAHKVFFGAVGVEPGTGGLHFSIWMLLPLAGIITALFGIIIGLPTLRLRGDYLAIATLGAGEIIRIAILNVDAVGGARGFSLASAAHPGVDLRFDSLAGVYGVAALVIAAIARLVYAGGGLAFRAVREDETAAESLGIATTRVKVEAFLVSSFFAGVAGALFAHSEGYIHTNSFSFVRSFEIVTFVVLGGLGSLSGAIVAAAVLTAAPELLRGLGEWRMILYSLLLIAAMILRPQGLLGQRELWPLSRIGAPEPREKADGVPRA